jgi:hypothetical protein
MTVQEFVDLVREVSSDFEREEDQGVLQEDMSKEQMALAGRHACDRILRAIEAREGIRVVNPRRMGRAR